MSDIVDQVLMQSPTHITADYIKGLMTAMPEATVPDLLAVIYDIKKPEQKRDEWRERNDTMDDIYLSMNKR